jgi:hypothetical protein
MTTVDGSDVTAPEGATVQFEFDVPKATLCGQRGRRRSTSASTTSLIHELTVLRSLSASCFTSPMTSALKRIGTCVDSVCAARRRPGPAGVRLSGSA